MGCGGNRAGDRLRVDVPLVLECQALRCQNWTELMQSDSAFDRDPTPITVDLEDPLHPRRVDHHTVGACAVGEGVA